MIDEKRLEEIKKEIDEKQKYYTKIDFPVLAKHFSDFIEIITELEELRAQLRKKEEEDTQKVQENAKARDGEECLD